MVGPVTRSKLFGTGNSNTGSGQPLLQRGDNGDAVKSLQNALISHGYSCGSAGADGDFGSSTRSAVILFQGFNRLSTDGIVGPATWTALFSLTCVNYWNTSHSYSTPEHKEQIKNFLRIAKRELDIGCVEGKDSNSDGDNKTRFGRWYGLNGRPWCTMFVSYCADTAGLTPMYIPKFCYVPNGVFWFEKIGKLHHRLEGYIPKPGDVFFHFNGSEWSHTGIVYECYDGYVITIEGNCNDMLLSRKLFLDPNDSRKTYASDMYTLDAFGEV